MYLCIQSNTWLIREHFFSTASLICLVNYFSFCTPSFDVSSMNFCTFSHTHTHTRPANEMTQIFQRFANPITIINLTVLWSHIRLHTDTCYRYYFHRVLFFVAIARASFIKMWQATDCSSVFKQSQKLNPNRKKTMILKLRCCNFAHSHNSIKLDEWEVRDKRSQCDKVSFFSLLFKRWIASRYLLGCQMMANDGVSYRQKW